MAEMSDASKARLARLKRDFEGRTIETVEAPTINVVHFNFTDGSRASIGADYNHYGVSVVGADSWDGDSAKG